MAITGGSFININAAPIEDAARKFGGFKGRLDGMKGLVGAAMVEKVKEALLGIYGAELGATGEMWQLLWNSGSGSQLGSLRVVSMHPYVIGYEFGTPAHLIEARALRGLPGAVNLVFWWEKEGMTFTGPRVNHPGSRGHHRLPYLESYLLELSTWGWGGAVKAAIADKPYGYGAAKAPAAPRLFNPTDTDQIDQVYFRPRGS